MDPTYITPDELHALQQKAGVKTVVIDVRGSDYHEGHIPGAINIPSTEFEAKLDHTLTTHQHVDTIVMHCMLSQVRGPTCASMLSKHMKTKAKNASSTESPASSSSEENKSSSSAVKFPRLCILRGGFDGWVRWSYGKDIKSESSPGYHASSDDEDPGPKQGGGYSSIGL